MSLKSKFQGSVMVAAVVAVGLLTTSAAQAGDVDVDKLWSKHCQTCHGPDGKGKTKAGEKAGVKDLTAADVKAELTKDKALKSMTDGVKAKDGDKLVMKSFKDKLSDAEMQALAEHSLSFK